ncbi:MAG TPA: sulfotransferase [Rhizomicrobium sp.]|nr:sulfotransferase [Rhizomicrobium sp.]
MAAPKVFGIGFQKTGTSSLDAAFRILGYATDKGVFINEPRKRDSVHIAPPLTNENVLAAVLPIADSREAFSDNPWPLLFREMDTRYPGSKFILTVRDPREWIASVVRHFGDRPSDMTQWIYGVPCPAGHEARCLEVYEKHNAAVRAHFASRPADLLELDLSVKPRWDALCAFLGKPAPDSPFPHENPATERERKQNSVWRRFKQRLRSGVP